MYTVNVLIEGDAPIRQHAFSPSVRPECSVIGAAGNFKIAGKRD